MDYTNDSLFAKGEPDGDDDTDGRDSDDNDLINSEGKPHKNYRGDSHHNLNDVNDSSCYKGEPDGDEDVEWRDTKDDDLIESKGKPYESNMKIKIGIKEIQMTIFVLKVRRMAMKISNGETVTMMTSLMMMVSSPKLILKIDIGFKKKTNDSLCATGERDSNEDADWRDGEDDDFMDSEGKLYESNMKFDIGVKIIQLIIFVLKVSRMAMKMSNGETVTVMISSIVTVNLMKLIMKIQNGIKVILTTLFVLQVSQMAMKMPIG